MIVVAERRAGAVMARFDRHKVAELRPLNLRIVTIIAVAATLALIAAIWLLEVQPSGASGA